MHRKWLGWKKVAVCLVGAAMIMQGASLAMAAEENPTTNQESSAAEENDQDTSSEGTDETEKDAEEDTEESEDEDAEDQEEDETGDEEDSDTDEDVDTVLSKDSVDPEETPEESDEVLEAEENGTDAEEVGLLVTGTVSHIDMSRMATATLTVGDKTLSQTVVFDADDLGTISVSPDYSGAIILGEAQIHIAGVFPVGTYCDPQEYTVSITKDVTFTDPDTGKTYTQTMTFTSSFNYWDEGNMCPSLGWREYWSNGFVIPWSGMDFGFGTASAVIPAPTEPVVSPAPTEPAVSPAPTEPAVSPAPTEPAVSPAPTEPAVSPVPTEPAVSPVPTEPAVSPAPTQPEVSPAPGETDPTATPTVTPDPDATETPAPTVTNAGNNGGTGTNGTGSDNNASGNQKSDGVKTADETNVAGSALMFLFAFVDVVLAFWALRLKHRRNK